MKRSRAVPYIGITDFTSAEQVRRILRIPYDKVMDPKMDHVLGVGVMMSYKTLRGLPTRWANAFPPKETIAGIFIDSPGVYNVLHYADYDNVSTAGEFAEVVECGGPNLNAIQLDMVWPDLHQVRSGFTSCLAWPSSLKIILQVGSQAMEAVGNDPERIAERLVPYVEANCAQYVLLDKSGGQGKGMDAELLLSYHRAIRKRFSRDELKIVVAGGLGPDTLRLLKPFWRDETHLDISIDAQGKLRSSGSALDPIEWDLAALYYERAVRLFGGSFFSE